MEANLTENNGEVFMQGEIPDENCSGRPRRIRTQRRNADDDVRMLREAQRRSLQELKKQKADEARRMLRKRRREEP